MSEVVTIKDKQFEKFIEFRQIQTAINRIAREMDDDLRDKNHRSLRNNFCTLSFLSGNIYYQ